MERFAMLADNTSTYYRMVNEIIREGALAQRRAEEARMEVLIPMVLPDAYRVELERKFGWKLKAKDYGVRSKLSPSVAALSFLMGLRNTMMVGNDGEEALYIDGDLPSLVAKGMTYGHVCRTHATDRLSAGYQFEEIQLSQLFKNGGHSVAMAADVVLQSLKSGDGTRVCGNAATCTRSADTVFFNHIMTPVSLAQAVATARAHRAGVVRGVCLFQPEMLVKDCGELEAFPGQFVVDRRSDVISFIPREDPSLSFSHPYQALMSFFVNHEYVDATDAWLVEKHMSGDGIFHYIIRRETLKASFSEMLSVNYYSEDMTRWVYLTYTSFFDEVRGVIVDTPRRVRVPLLKYVYDKVMPILLSIDLKRLTFDEVFTLLRNHNNMLFANGTTVRKPERVWYEDLKRAVVPLKAMALVRRECASAELRVLLDGIKVRAGLHDTWSAALLWTGIQMRTTELARTALVTAGLEEAVSLVDLWRNGIDMSVKIEYGSEYLNISHASGEKHAGSYGSMESWLPGRKFTFSALIARANAYIATRGVSVHSSVVTSEDYDYDVTMLAGSGGVVADDAAVPLATVDVDVSPLLPVSEAGRKDLLEKLAAQHDALALIRPPRIVSCFEGSTRVDVEVTPLCATDPVAVGQADYDLIYPGVSLSDEEVKPYMAVESDLHVEVEFNGEINDAKRELPKAKVIRRSKIRTGGGGALPKCQASLLNGVFRRNAVVPNSRGFVPLDTVSTEIIDRILRVCYRPGWENILAAELETGLWQVVYEDLQEYVPKVPTHQIEVMMKEFFVSSDENLSRWLLMLKSVAKPPMDFDAASKVQSAQTIMYSDQKTVNAKYSAMQTRFYYAVKSMMRPEVSFNNRDSPADHEVWYNSCEGKRSTVKYVYGYEGDLFCFDRSQEHMVQVFELAFYRRHGLNEDTLARWAETHGVKKATSMMYGVVLHIAMQGLSGIWKTLFRNGLVCLGAVVHSFSLEPDDFVTLDVVGDDFAIEAVRPLNMQRAIEHFALTFNLTAKLFDASVAYMCSKYWIKVNGWWYYVQDPMRKFESVSNAVLASSVEDTGLAEKWISLRDDLRHYDNALVMEALGEAVAVRMGFRFAPMGIIRCLATLADDRGEYFNSFGPEEYVGY